MIEGISELSGPAAAGPSARSRDNPARIEDAARQFEALLLSQILKSLRESASGGGMGGSDSASDCAMSIAEEHFARSLASSGGLGLAKLVVAGLGAPPEAAGGDPRTTHSTPAPP